MNIEKIISSYNIKDENVKSEITNHYERLRELADSCEKPNIVWDATVAKYSAQMSKFRKVLENSDIKQNIPANIFSNLDKFADMCNKPEFHIAFVGAIKAGKSTLINSLLGYDLASTSVTPETASLTKFKASDSNNYINITFYTSNEWTELWNSVTKSKADVFIEEYNKLNADSEKNNWINKPVFTKEFDNLIELKTEIQKWTSSKSATHYFVKEVEVGLTNLKVPQGVVFVDTPGLDDPVEYRSNITRDYINRANAVLVCVRSDALTGGELRTIYRVFANSKYNPEKIYVVGTQLDTLNRPVNDWKLQQQEWCKHLSKSVCYGTQALAENNIIGVSGYLFNLVTNYNNLSDDDIYDIASIAIKFRIKDYEQNLDDLKALSNVSSLKSKLKNEILVKHKEILVNDIATVYKDLKLELQTSLNNIYNNQTELLRIADADIEEIRKQREESNLVLEDAQKQKVEMQKALKQIKSLTEVRAEELYNQIRSLGGR